MTKIMHWTTGDWLNLATEIVTVASVLRVALHWVRNIPLLQFIPAGSWFWKLFDAVEATLGYVAISLSSLGKKTPASQLDAPVTQAASPAEGQIVEAVTKPLDETRVN